MIEAWVNEAWCPVAGVSQITKRPDVTVAELLYGAMCLQTCEVAHPVLGVVAIHPRMFAWRPSGEPRRDFLLGPSPELRAMWDDRG